MDLGTHACEGPVDVASSIAGLLRTRGTTNNNLIRGIIESEASAPREGTLG